MSQVTYRGNLSAKTFPFISDNWGRTVITAGPDNTFNRQVSSAEDPDRDVGIPQIYYCHNVMPFAQGFQSVGYQQVVGSPGPGLQFTSVVLVRDDEDNKALLGFTITGDCYVSFGSGWVFETGFVNAANNGLVTTAYVSGITYIYIHNQGCYKYNFITNNFELIPLVGLVPTEVIGICGVAGYLLAYNKTTVAWSSTVDPTDFVPSLITGAGSGSVEGARGSIQFVIAHLLGFIVYTTANAVAGLFTSNARFPFQFREIVGSGGVSAINLITYDANSAAQYAYTTSGLQLIGPNSSNTTNPEVTDFISGKLFEDFDEALDIITQTPLSTTMKKSISLVAERYLVISYGISSLTHALVYDVVQKRYGKLKIPHVQCFEFEFPNAFVTEIPKQSIGFLQESGRIVTVDFDTYSVASNGVMLLGKFQYVRARLIQLDEIWLEDVVNPSNFIFKVWPAIEGKVTTEVTPYQAGNSGGQQHYMCRAQGINFSLLFKQQFKIESLVMSFNILGKR